MITDHEEGVVLERSIGYGRHCKLNFSPLDEELGLLPGRYTPRLQAAFTRMGSKMPFREAVEEAWYGHKTAVGEGTEAFESWFTRTD